MYILNYSIYIYIYIVKFYYSIIYIVNLTLTNISYLNVYCGFNYLLKLTILLLRTELIKAILKFCCFDKVCF